MWQHPWLSEYFLQLLFFYLKILQRFSACPLSHWRARVICNSRKFVLQFNFSHVLVLNTLIIFLYVFNSLSTSPNSLGCVRIHCWKHRSSSCCPGAASSQLKPVDFQVSAVWLTCRVCVCCHVSALCGAEVRQNTNPVLWTAALFPSGVSSRLHALTCSLLQNISGTSSCWTGKLCCFKASLWPLARHKPVNDVCTFSVVWTWPSAQFPAQEQMEFLFSPHQH